MRRIVRLPPSRIEDASRLLARAFFNDPLQRYTFPDPVQRAELSVPHFEAITRYGHLAGEVWVTEGSLDGVAIWCGPGTQPNEVLLEEAGIMQLPDVIGHGPSARFSQVIDHVDLLHHRDVPEPHWSLMVIGVDPDCHGQGIGSALLEPVLAKADESKLCCYLETCQPRNVPFYRKHGFEVLVEGVEPLSKLQFWTFLRRPH